MKSLIRSLICETLLTEEVFGAQAFVYHGSRLPPEKFIPLILSTNDFDPGKKTGALYGKGLYAVYDLKNSKTARGGYGEYIYKLKINLYDYLIFDRHVAKLVYGQPLTVIEQAERIGLDEEIINSLKKVGFNNRFTSYSVESAAPFLQGNVKGLVYTHPIDLRCVLIYDHTTAVPSSWTKIDMSDDMYDFDYEIDISKNKWHKIDRSSLRTNLRKSATGTWEKEKYTDIGKLLRSQKDSSGKKVWNGDVDLSEKHIVNIPDNLTINGNVDLSYSKIKKIPDNFEVTGDLDISFCDYIVELPKTLKVGGDLNIRYTQIEEVPSSVKVGGQIIRK